MKHPSEPPASLPAPALSSFNALTHGAASQSLFLPDEDPTRFFALLEELFSHYQPGNAQDADIVADAVLARWFLTRRQRAYAQSELQLHQTLPNPSDWTEADLHRLELLDRYKTHAERAFRRALTNVQAIRKDALTQLRWQEQLEMQRLRFELKRETFAYAKATDPRFARKDVPTPEPDDIDEDADLKPVQTCPESGDSIILQRAFIGVTDGQTIIRGILPDNDEVRKIIARRESYPKPPQRIVRQFSFTSIIPAEYQTLLKDSDPDTDGEFTYVKVSLSFAAWHPIAEKEDALIKSQRAAEAT